MTNSRKNIFAVLMAAFDLIPEAGRRALHDCVFNIDPVQACEIYNARGLAGLLGWIRHLEWELLCDHPQAATHVKYPGDHPQAHPEFEAAASNGRSAL